MSDPWFKFYPSDWLGGTRGLSAAETGVYITLVCLMHESEGPVMITEDRLARQLGMPVRNFRRCIEALKSLGKLVEKDGGLWNERVAETLDMRAQNAVMKSQAARSRWDKNKEKQRPENAGALHTHTDTRSQKLEEDTDVSSTPAKPKPRKHRISDEAEITEPMRKAADKRGHSQQEAEAQFDRFKNDAIAKAKTFACWDRAFITWLDSPYFRKIINGGQTDAKRGRDGEAAERARRAGERWAARAVDCGQSGNAAVALFPTGQPFGGSGGGS